MPAHPANQADIIFDITEGNLRDSFDIVKRYVDGMTVGECKGTAVGEDEGMAVGEGEGRLRLRATPGASGPAQPPAAASSPVRARLPSGPAGTLPCPPDPAPTGCFPGTCLAVGVSQP